MWRWFGKEFDRLNAQNACLKPSEAIQTLFNRIDELLITFGAVPSKANQKQYSNALWKEARLNLGFHATNLAKLHVSIVDLLKELKTNEHGLARLSLADRSTLSDAMATLRWLNATTASTSTPAQLQMVNELCLSLATVPDQIKSKLQTGSVANSIVQPQFAIAVDEHVALHLELTTISQIFAGLVGLALTETQRGNSQLQLAHSKTSPVLIQHLLKHCRTSSPTDTSTYQLFRWLRDKPTTTTPTGSPFFFFPTPSLQPIN